MSTTDYRAPTPPDRIVGAYLLLTALPLALPGRPAAWPLLLAAHLGLALAVLHRPTRDLLLRRVDVRWPAVWRFGRAWYPLLLVPLLYRELPLLHAPLHGGRYFDELLLGWEAAIFGGQPSREWAAAAPWLWLSELLHGAYLSYYAIIVGPPLLLWWRGRQRDFQMVVTAFLLAATAHYLVFLAFPVQGPRYLFPAPTGGGIEEGPLYRLTHAVLESGSSRGTAFPSGHVGISVAITLASARCLPRLAPVLALLTLLLSVATAYGGFHYLLDALAGALLGALAAAVALRWTARPAAAPPRGISPAPPAPPPPRRQRARLG